MPKIFSDYLAVLSDLVLRSGGNLQAPILGACCDSRECQPGFLFCAMQGERLDGHHFIEQALQRGAVAILSEREVPLPEKVPWVTVKEPYPAFGRVAELAADFPAHTMKLLGVTGTNGKTTTAYLLREILKAAGQKPGMIGTVEYDVGGERCRTAERTTPTPFQLQQLFIEMKNNGVTDAVLEVSSHALAQERLGTARFCGAAFTNLTRDHLDYHGDFEQYYQCKKRLFSQLLDVDCPMVVNMDDPWGQRLASEVTARKQLTYSLHKHPSANIQADNLFQDENQTTFDLHFPDCTWHLHSPLTGFFNICNLTSAACLAYGLGIAEASVQQAFLRCHGAPGRLQRLTGKSGLNVFVDYAHTDDALRNVLGALRPICKGRLFVVFGCGGNRDRSKRPLMAKAAEENADQIIVTSDNPRFEKPEDIIKDILVGFSSLKRITVQPDREAAILETIARATPQDIILLAGKGHEEYQEINGVKHHFNDAETARKYLN
ncbi:MAG: UDP-N-acetylmuramoyl-L-alanyl-D-glutamate--2,6-diaminopimelate ligase [Lentisphaerae bacterium]|jgi:UDP-N-acetylmuramoyl-L-alanyl-D-glutamate--2,6-diaminopimelate ligase|nr:UDP-N-acetylmuramoyl-L-alanyl-D-glutamate--2,6-diaminopimelate ligase [Lentisphaerota bacterium]